MKKLKFDFKTLTITAAGLMFLVNSTAAVYMKMDPPPDADKASLAGNNSCWLATAANMLAGAGYGTGSTVQERAEDIYEDMTDNFGTANGGWTDTALSWWLSSNNNDQQLNSYRIVTVRGNKSRQPWENSNGAYFIGNKLRDCSMLGFSISWPRSSENGSASGGHAFTCWGDSGNEKSLTNNPESVYTTDSDRDNGGDVQIYSYDSYTDPNPDGFDEGDGWYINYNDNHPFIKHIATLSPRNFGGFFDFDFTIQAKSSYRIRQSISFMEANGLHYKAGGNNNLLTYKTSIDHQTENKPLIKEDGNPPQELSVDWDLSDNTVPFASWVTITTEFVIGWPFRSGFSYQDVHFKYPEEGNILPMPELICSIDTTLLKTDKPSQVPNVTGGYVIAGFDLISVDKEGKADQVVAEYRFTQEYNYRQNPELHNFELISEESEPYLVGNLRFGHSYGSPEKDELWAFDDWITHYPEQMPLNQVPGIQMNWEGMLPYPEGEDYEGEEKPLKCSVFLPEDINEDCYVDLTDFKLLASRWLQTTAR